MQETLTTMARTAKKAADKPGAKAAAKRRSSRAQSAPPVSAVAGRKLVVVESPAKAKTINRYLGNDYIVRASYGHVRDLPPKEMGVDIENDFKPTYTAISRPRQEKVLPQLKRYAKAAGEVFLATDLDREGEAIAWHLAESFHLAPESVCRVVFNEITASAIRAAFANPRQLDMNKVNAQQARRILDRIVGYKVSPLLWRKVARGLSAGRVQSVAVRLIVERERAIEEFVPEEYWRIGTVFTPQIAQAKRIAGQWRVLLARRDERGRGPTLEAQQAFLADCGAFRAELAKWKGRKFRADNAETVMEVVQALGLTVKEATTSHKGPPDESADKSAQIVTRIGPETPAMKVAELNQRDRRSKPPAPFITSSLQQTASVRLHSSPSRTMRTAQQLYEGVDLPDEGSVGLITYMRTDSRHLSKDAIEQCRSLIEKHFGSSYIPEKPNIFASGKRAQEAHEAIRPSDLSRKPEYLRAALTDEQYKLYELIWRRFVACQMSPAVWAVTEAVITAETPAGTAEFKALGRKLKFDGYLRVAGVPKSGDQLLPELQADQPVAPVDIAPAQHFTQPPPRFTEAALTKALEADGIGRPSTYASISKTIQDRQYVELLDRTFRPTAMGIVVTDKLVKHFPKVFDVHFTAHMEDELDRVEEGRLDWVKVLERFYGPFQDSLEHAAENMVHAKAESQPSDYVCEKCSKPMVYKFARNGRYLACTGYPDCKTTHPVDREGKKIETPVVDVACPKCGAPLILRRGRFGPFLSCSKYPECDGVVNLDKNGFIKQPSAPPLQVDMSCPKCEAPLNLRRSKRGPWLSCSKYPKCRGRQGWKALSEDVKQDFETQLAAHEKAYPQPVIKTLDAVPVGEEHTPQPLGADAQAAPPAKP